MKINEFVNSPANPETNLATALEMIRNRYKDKKVPPKISTQSLIQMILNTDRTFDYDALTAAVENNPTIKNLIKSFNKDFVQLRPKNDTGDETTTVTPQGDTAENPVISVSDMAKRAAKERGAAV